MRNNSIKDNLVGKTVKEIYMNEDELTFVTDEGNVYLNVDGDCCSHSYLFDFYGVKRLLGNKIVDFEQIDLSEGDVGYRKETWEFETDEYNEILVYGYRITTIDTLFGEVSSVFSFRNSSNGYYGGSLEISDSDKRVLKETDLLTDDLIG